MNKENLPQVRKESVFGRIKNWFFIILHKGKNNKDETYNSIEELYEHNKNWIEGIKIENQHDILKLQNKLKQNKISISDLTDKELDDMIKLYKKQVEEKSMKIKQYRAKISA